MTQPTPKQPPKKRNRKDRRPYSRTGLCALKARVQVRGLSAIDLRTLAARALVQWRSDIVDHLGGEGHVSAQALALVEMATRTRLYVDHLDAWLLEQPTLINKRRKCVLPVLRERQQLVDSLARILGQLGLERRKPPPLDIGSYLAGKGSTTTTQDATPTSAGGSGHGDPPASPSVQPEGTESASSEVGP